MKVVIRIFILSFLIIKSQGRAVSSDRGFGGYVGSDSMGGLKDNSSFGYGNLKDISYGNHLKLKEKMMDKKSHDEQQSFLGVSTSQEAILNPGYFSSQRITSSRKDANTNQYFGIQNNVRQAKERNSAGGIRQNGVGTRGTTSRYRDEKQKSSQIPKTSRRGGSSRSQSYQYFYEIDIGEKNPGAEWKVDQNNQRVLYGLKQNHGYGASSNVYFSLNNSH